MPQAWLRKRIDRALRDVDIVEVLPARLLDQLGLAALKPSIGRLHHPPPDADAHALAERTDPAWRRLKFDELLAQQIALRAARVAREQRRAHPLQGSGELTTKLRDALPFRLTAAQDRVWIEVERDLAGARPMHRLVQGDVGSGKTVIAALAAARAIECGFQVALMAPTEILAEQHFRKIAQWLAPLDVNVAWLVGRLTAAAKRGAQQAVASGAAQLVVGTHALIQDAVEFHRLGLAIVDEQHRFGVAQRLALRGEGRTRPAAAPADAVGHADPAHAGDELPRRPRRLGDRRAAARPPAGGDEARFDAPARGSDGADPGRGARGAPGVLGLPADRGERRDRGDRGHRDARAHHGTAPGPADRAAARPAARGREVGRDAGLRGARRSTCWWRPP